MNAGIRLGICAIFCCTKKHFALEHFLALIACISISMNVCSVCLSFASPRRAHLYLYRSFASLHCESTVYTVHLQCTMCGTRYLDTQHIRAACLTRVASRERCDVIRSKALAHISRVSLWATTDDCTGDVSSKPRLRLSHSRSLLN